MTSVRIVLCIALTALAACGDGSAPAASGEPDAGSDPLAEALEGLGTDFVRVGDRPLLNPRELVAPISRQVSMFGILDPCAVWDEDAGLWRVYWSYSDVASEALGAISSGIVGATSSDGINYTMNDVLSIEPIGTFDTSTIETCDVVIVGEGADRVFYMFYSGSQSENPADPEALSKYKIALARSQDGIRFTPISAEESPVGAEGVLFGTPEVTGGPDVFGNFITDPVVVVRDGTFHMWTLCIEQFPQTFGGVCYHTSNDALNWTQHGLVNGLQRAFPVQPTVYYNPVARRFEMYVVMDTPDEEREIHDLQTNLTLRVKGFFHAVSEDGMRWTEVDPTRHQFVEDLRRRWENRGLATGADAEIKEGVVYLFYPSFTTEGADFVGTLLGWPMNLAVRRAMAN